MSTVHKMPRRTSGAERLQTRVRVLEAARAHPELGPTALGRLFDPPPRHTINRSIDFDAVGRPGRLHRGTQGQTPPGASSQAEQDMEEVRFTFFCYHELRRTLFCGRLARL